MKCLRACLSVLALALITDVAMAFPGGTNVPLQTPEERAQAWQDSFLKFVAEHPELSIEKKQALEDLADIEDVSIFSNAPAKNKRNFLEQRMAQLTHVLSAFEYQQLIADTPQELVRWMKNNEVIEEPVGTLSNCNCSNNADCTVGRSCVDETCIHEAGTTHIGRCK